MRIWSNTDNVFAKLEFVVGVGNGQKFWLPSTVGIWFSENNLDSYGDALALAHVYIIYFFS